MATKTTGAEFKRFYSDPKFWPDDKGETYHDDEMIVVDGVLVDGNYDLAAVPPGAKMSIEGGAVYSPTFAEGTEPSLETYFKRWRKVQNTATLVVECDIAKLEAVKAAIAAAGGKVL